MRTRAQDIGKVMLMALPLAGGWTIYTAQEGPGNFALGYVLSLLAVYASGLRGDSVKLRNAPRQLFSLMEYVVFMAWEVLRSGVRVAWVVLSPAMPVESRTVYVDTQDETGNQLISAISAHGITITPGELVVDFEETKGEGVTMIVHSLWRTADEDSLKEDQKARLKRIKRILGHD